MSEPRNDPSLPVVAIDLYHGIIPPNIGELLRQRAFLQRNPFEIRLLNTRLADDTLANTDVFIVASMGHTSDIHFKEPEIGVIDAFVRGGGGLLCAGQAWSWVYPSYGNKSVETFPLNELGNRLGFKITGKNIGSPVLYPSEITAGINVVTQNH